MFMHCIVIVFSLADKTFREKWKLVFDFDQSGLVVMGSLCVDEWIIKADDVMEFLWVIATNQWRAAVYLGHAFVLSAKREDDGESEVSKRRAE